MLQGESFDHAGLGLQNVKLTVFTYRNVITYRNVHLLAIGCCAWQWVDRACRRMGSSCFVAGARAT